MACVLLLLAVLFSPLTAMGCSDHGGPPTVFSRDIGRTRQDAPNLDPFAALRHLNAFRAASSHPTSSQPSGIVVSLSGAAPTVSTPTGAGRRPLDLSDDKLADTPPVKKAKVNNTIVSMCAAF